MVPPRQLSNVRSWRTFLSKERRLKRRGWGVEDAFHVCVVSWRGGEGCDFKHAFITC